MESTKKILSQKSCLLWRIHTMYRLTSLHQKRTRNVELSIVSHMQSSWVPLDGSVKSEAPVIHPWEFWTLSNRQDDFLRLAHKSGPLLRGDIRPYSEIGIQSLEIGTLVAHFPIQNHWKVDLTYENQFVTFLSSQILNASKESFKTWRSVCNVEPSKFGLK
jgi:hypothetical protein